MESSDLRPLGAIADLSLRVTAASARMRRDVERCVEQLNGLLCEAPSDTRIAASLAACGIALARTDGRELALELQQNADGRFPLIEGWLQAAAPRKQLLRGARLSDARVATTRRQVLSVLTRRQPNDYFARGPGFAHALDAVLWDPDPHFIGRVLNAPLIHVRDLVTIARRRPTTPELVQMIVDRPACIRHPAVRRTLVLNPFTPPEVALRLTATLGFDVARRLARDIGAHDAVRGFCGLWVSEIDRAMTAADRSQAAAGRLETLALDSRS